jgi:predicted CXXCH cytochrome family protein
MRKRVYGLILLCVLVGARCSGTGSWDYTRLAEIPPQGDVPMANTCMGCHETEYETWKKTGHAKETSMRRITPGQLRECGACHDNLAAHIAAPGENTPEHITALAKSDQNMLCGVCHFNEEVFGHNAINPGLDHGLFTSVGFDEGKKQQLSCLDCHRGHSGRRNMLQRMQAHTCFTCHKSAIVSMGVFQPFNYLAGGKVCTSCHTPHGTSKAGHAARMTVGVAATCVVCHLP